MSQDEQFKRGLQMRKQVMGEAFVDKAFADVDTFTAPLQEFVTRNAWGTSWCREGLDLKTRSLITLSMLTALGPLKGDRPQFSVSQFRMQPSRIKIGAIGPSQRAKFDTNLGEEIGVA